MSPSRSKGCRKYTAFGASAFVRGQHSFSSSKMTGILTSPSCRMLPNASGRLTRLDVQSRIITSGRCCSSHESPSSKFKQALTSQKASLVSMISMIALTIPLPEITRTFFILSLLKKVDPSTYAIQLDHLGD